MSGGRRPHRRALPPALRGASRRSTTTCAWRSTAPAASTRSPARPATSSPSPRSTPALTAEQAHAAPAARRRRPALRARTLGRHRRAPRDHLRQRRLRPAGAVRRRGRRQARLARDLPRVVAGALRRGRRRLQRRRAVPPEPDQGGRQRRDLPEPPGRERHRDRRPRGLRPAGGLDHVERRLGAPMGRHRRRQRRRRGGGDAARRRHQLRLSLHAVPDRRPRLPGGGAVRVGSGRGSHLVAGEPAAERGPGLLPRVALPRPPRRRDDRVHRRLGQLRARRHRR